MSELDWVQWISGFLGMSSKVNVRQGNGDGEYRSFLEQFCF